MFSASKYPYRQMSRDSAIEQAKANRGGMSAGKDADAPIHPGMRRRRLTRSKTREPAEEQEHYGHPQVSDVRKRVRSTRGQRRSSSWTRNMAVIMRSMKTARTEPTPQPNPSA
jgi:hypothetical protein